MCGIYSTNVLLDRLHLHRVLGSDACGRRRHSVGLLFLAAMAPAKEVAAAANGYGDHKARKRDPDAQLVGHPKPTPFYLEVRGDGKGLDGGREGHLQQRQAMQMQRAMRSRRAGREIQREKANVMF